MTPAQLELRRSLNTVHYVLNKEHQVDPLLTCNQVRMVLGYTPKFIPTPRRTTTKDVARYCDVLGYRLTKTFNRFISLNFIQQARENSLAAGIIPWTPEQYPYSDAYYGGFIRDYFDVKKPSGWFWRTHRDKCPGLQNFITSFKRDAMRCMSGISSRGISSKSNMTLAERNLIQTLAKYNVGYNISDKMLGPVLYSRDLFLEQCALHLYDGKNTYEPISGGRDEILQHIVNKLKRLLTACCHGSPALIQLATTLRKYAEDSLKYGSLCKFYVIWKLHKAPNARGVRSRPIASQTRYPTRRLSQFLHSQLVDAVMNHPHVLKDSISLIRRLDSMKLSCLDNFYLTAADVEALYPSIKLEDGMKALSWFMKEHTKFPIQLQRLYLEFARFVLENNYVECEGLAGQTVFLQKIGTAMGTPFSVTYATIFMIWLETPVIHEFREYILLYKRYIDDLFIIWSGSPENLCRFRARLGTANANIKLEWQGTPSAVDAVDPAKFDQYKHRRVNFLDLNIRIVYPTEPTQSVHFEYSVYRKPGNAYSYLPYGSYHARHVFRGWLQAEIYRLLTHCSSPETWIEECRVFYDHLRQRGYPATAINPIFHKISWSKRQELLEERSRGKNESFFATYRGCVISARNAPGCRQLQGKLDLSLDTLRIDSMGREIFPPRAFFSVKSALPMGCTLRR